MDEETINMVVPKVPNNKAWDAKLQGTEGHNETSISYVRDTNGTRERMSTLMIYLHAV